MKIVFSVLLVLLTTVSAETDDRVDEIYDRLSAGDLTAATAEFRQMPQSAVRDGNRLFVTALLEADARRCRDLLLAATQSDLDGKYREEAGFRLIQVAEALGNTADVLSLADRFLQQWEDSRFRGQVMTMLAAHTATDNSDGNRYLNILIDEYSGSYFGQYARLAKAEAAFGRGHYKTAATECRRINNSTEDDLVPSSLILLSRIALKQNEAEKALLNYNILREQYRNAIGQEELIAELQQVSDRQSGHESTEIFEGISYSVQVGVFSVKDNAKIMAQRIEAYGYKVRTDKRDVSGQAYYFVLAGRFRTLQDAEAAKEKLELAENQIFKVVVNDEK